MCRFAIVFSNKSFPVMPVLKKFASMSLENPSPEGDEQKDGWGIFYENGERNYLLKSNQPIWEDIKKIKFTTRAKKIFLHSRSASFFSQKLRLDFTQPFLTKNFIYVFNGMVSKVKIPFKLDGEVGARKILSLIEKYQIDFNLKSAILKAVDTIRKNSKKIFGFNMALYFRNNLYVYSEANEFKDYYQLYYGLTDDFFILSSANGLFLEKDCLNFFGKKTKVMKIEFRKIYQFTFNWL